MGANSRILQFASSAAFLPQPGFAVYAATKGLRIKLQPRSGRGGQKNRGIYVTAVCPGACEDGNFFDMPRLQEAFLSTKALAMADPKKVVKLAIRDSVM